MLRGDARDPGGRLCAAGDCRHRKGASFRGGLAPCRRRGADLTGARDRLLRRGSGLRGIADDLGVHVEPGRPATSHAEGESSRGRKTRCGSADTAVAVALSVPPAARPANGRLSGWLLPRKLGTGPTPPEVLSPAADVHLPNPKQDECEGRPLPNRCQLTSFRTRRAASDMITTRPPNEKTAGPSGGVPRSFLEDARRSLEPGLKKALPCLPRCFVEIKVFLLDPIADQPCPDSLVSQQHIASRLLFVSNQRS